MLWHCWLGVRNSIRPVKNGVMRCWRGSAGSYANHSRHLSGVICIWSSWCHCHPIISSFIKIQTGLTFLVLAYPGCPEKRPLNGCLSDFVVLPEWVGCREIWLTMADLPALCPTQQHTATRCTRNKNKLINCCNWNLTPQNDMDRRPEVGSHVSQRSIKQMLRHSRPVSSTINTC